MLGPPEVSGRLSRFRVPQRARRVRRPGWPASAAAGGHDPQQRYEWRAIHTLAGATPEAKRWQFRPPEGERWAAVVAGRLSEFSP